VEKCCLDDFASAAHHFASLPPSSSSPCVVRRKGGRDGVRRKSISGVFEPKAEDEIIVENQHTKLGGGR
jgi:hypothetical protein